MYNFILTKSYSFKNHNMEDIASLNKKDKGNVIN